MGSGLTLYQISAELAHAAERMADLELAPEVIADTLEGMSGALEQKATNVVMVARNLEATAAAIKDAEAKMAARRKALESRAASLRDYVLTCLQHAGVKKVEGPYLSIAIRENPPKVVIDAENLIPAEFFRAPPPPPPELDKAQIAAVLKAGGEVPGAHLERGVRLDVR